MRESLRRQNELNAILIKPAGPDCNLRCDYCFYLEKHRLFPASKLHRMSDELLEILIKQMMALPRPHLSFGWQGGEPTLMGLSFFEKAVTHQIKYGRGKTVGNSLQTNGVLLDDRWARFFLKYNFLVGISLDGPRHIHDCHRKTAGGNGSWQRTFDAAKMLLDRGTAVNALCVVTDYAARFPVEIYSFLKDAGLTYQQYIPCLEPSPGQGVPDNRFSVSPEAYGDFLCALFDVWVGDFEFGRPRVSIRFFDSVLNHYLGAPPSDCTLLDRCGVYLTIEHNGDVYPCDFYVLESQKLGNLMHASLSDLFQSDPMEKFRDRKKNRAPACGDCKWESICRGGCPKDRHIVQGRTDVSYFCTSYRRFFDHANSTLQILATRLKTADAPPTSAIGDTGHPPPPRVGRNEPCPCGSGKKFKKCCLKA